ncbi:chitinase-3-like protein 1 [Anopheles stephensi]|uniref:chitinase-3-like protein 1 n=1 Tax=Anopheles stephensi TaxID=30069 RepID=UPI0016587F5A|nr:chitinase-3-like protein 1 [Anopheles stephensi]
MIRPILLCLSLFVVFSSIEARKPVFCYYASWATYRPGRGRFDVDHIDPFLCTHLLYAFFGVDESGAVTVLDPWLDLEVNGGRANIRRFNELRQQNPQLRTLAAIGGATVHPTLFSQIAASASTRGAFAQNARDFCLTHGFDGVDVGWEFPAMHDGDTTNDKANFVLLLSELAVELRSRGLLLTGALAASQTIASISYDIPGIVPHLDFINLMAYDYNGAWNNFTGHNAPLFAGPSDQNDFQRMLNVDHSINYWLGQGAPLSKLVLGVPAYGRSFTLSNAASNGLRAPSDGPGLPGPYTLQSGYMAYHEACAHFLPGSGWHRVWEPVQRIPYGFLDSQWIGYDDRDSILEKCNYVNNRNLAGMMMWSIDMDDFRGYCGSQFNLLRAINDCLT